MKPRNGFYYLALASALLALLPAPALAQAAEPPSDETTQAPESVVPRFQARDERQRELQVSAYPEEARLLQTLEGEVLALYLPPLSRTPKGALLLTYTGERPGDLPFAWDTLRRALPRYGWGTLLVALPAEAPAAIPPRPLDSKEVQESPAAQQTEKAEPTQNPASVTTTQPAPVPIKPAIPRAQRIASRLEAAILQLEQEGQLNLVVMVDNLSVAAAVAHLKPGLKISDAKKSGNQNRGQSPLAGPVRALILANIHPQDPMSNQDLAQIFSIAQLPVLDLFLGPDSASETRRHEGQSQRHKMVNYQALTLPYPHAVNLKGQQSFWIKRLEGFMSRQAKGQEERSIDVSNL